MALRWISFWIFVALHQNIAMSGSLTNQIESLRICLDHNNSLVVATNISHPCNSPVAESNFRNEINISGWSFLEIQTFPQHEDEIQAYSAGLAEGYSTRQLIQWHWENTIKWTRFDCKDDNSTFCKDLNAILRKNFDWLEGQILQNPHDAYWRQVNLLLIQLSGLEDGFHDNIRQPHRNFSPFGFVLFQIFGDFHDLYSLLDWPVQLREKPFGGESCSALIVPLPGNSDILFSHVSWFPYNTMLRVQKLYKFAYTLDGSNGTRIPSTVISMSSYPGMLSSYDDFYLLKSGLSVMETSLANTNVSSYKYIMPKRSVPTWIRVMVANRLAETGEKWVDIFARLNSGTYNNQYMVLDYKKFVPGHPLPKSGLLYIVEQLPGFTKSADVTMVLSNQGYWASYNSPYFPEIFNLNGDAGRARQYGDWFTHKMTPRAQIFRRDWHNVTDLESLTSLMRSNNYKSDPLSICKKCTPPQNAINALSARGDLNPINGTYPFWQLKHSIFGATDLKVTNYSMIQQLRFYAISGPTFDEKAGILPFQWSQAEKTAENISHKGHPDLFKFEPVVNEWKFV